MRNKIFNNVLKFQGKMSSCLEVMNKKCGRGGRGAIMPLHPE